MSTHAGGIDRVLILIVLGLVAWFLWSRLKKPTTVINAGSSTVTTDANGVVTVGDVQAATDAPGP